MSAGGKLSPATRRDIMRRAFDDVFAAPASEAIESFQDLLAVRIGGDAYALRLMEVSGLHADLNVVPVPGPAPHLLGLCAIRGVMAPVYDLAGLLGYPPAPSTRWVALVGAPHRVGLALESFEAHLRVAHASTHLDPGASARPDRFARGAVHAAGGLRPILQISALMQSIREKAHDG